MEEHIPLTGLKGQRARAVWGWWLWGIGGKNYVEKAALKSAVIFIHGTQTA